MSDDVQVLRQALIEVRNLLGPDSICKCGPDDAEFCGLREEAAESLRIVREALTATGGGDVLDALAGRISSAADRLEEMAESLRGRGAVGQKRRLMAKASGLRLALSYIEDAKRGVS